MKKMFAGLLGLAVLLVCGGEVEAQKGRSYSSGSSFKPSGRSYSSGSSFKPSTPSYKPPAYKPPAYKPSGKSYSSGTTAPKTSPPAYTPPSTTAPKSTPTGKSYSSGSTTPKSSTPYTPPKTGPPSGKSYSVGGNSSKGKPGTTTSPLTKAAQKEESKIRYEAATKPKETYTTPKGKSVPIKASNTHVTKVRKYVTHEKYVTYDNRASTFYGPYYGQPQPYNDFFSPFLMGYLLSEAMNSHQRALFIHHHRSSIDDARYYDLLKKDAKLQAELDALKAKNVAVNPNYVPSQYADNPDLMYDKGFIDASYNPQAVQTNTAGGAGGSGVGTFFLWVFVIIVVLTVLGIFWYYMAVKDY